MSRISVVFIVISFVLLCTSSVLHSANIVEHGGIKSIEAGYTITKVRYATIGGEYVLVVSTYDGVVLCYSTDGTLLWENKLSGYMNHDMHCDDLNDDGEDEVMLANADGSLYCLNSEGKLEWKFQPNHAPMYSVTSIKHNNINYVVCGGYDLNYYYVDASTGQSKLIVPSGEYSLEKPWGSNIPPKNVSTVNFIKKCKDENGNDIIAVNGVMHSMATAGTLYLFRPMQKKPYKTIKFKQGATFGSMSFDNLSGNETRLMFGVSSMIDQAKLVTVPVSASESDVHYSLATLTKGNIDNFGYRVVQAEAFKVGDETKYFILYGSRVVLTPVGNVTDTGEVLACKYSFNDLCKHPTENVMCLASAQSGGSCIHIIDLENSQWKESYKNLNPIGNINEILSNSAELKQQLDKFKKPDWETERPKVYFMSDFGNNTNDKNINDIHANYASPLFLRSPWTNNVESPESWTRDALANEVYRDRRDGRKSYSWTQQQVLDWITPFSENDSKGFSIWGGHGNDPYYYSLNTAKKMVDLTSGDRQSVLIYPEMEGTGKDFAWMLDDLIYPLAQHCDLKEGHTKLFIRSKNIFWIANIYESHWHKLLSGEYADVFIPAMEETSDKTMELSISGRVGMWCSGAVNQWGGRCARDNTSFDRLRQHSHQMLPNHFLRMMVYQISLGATYLDNFQVNQEYMSLLWYMIAKGMLYVPQRNELLNINPVVLNMLEPDKEYLEDGTNVKWTTFYDSSKDGSNMVFSRMNGSWPGAATTEWDFSRYAAGVKDRRLNFLPSYNNGLVLMVPPYVASEPRGKITDHLHPMYSSIMKQYYTDGRNYYDNISKKQSFGANSYYNTISSDIEKSSKKLPITVDGEVAWVTAQSASNHLRLTLIDGGYLNPSEKEVTINFNTIIPAKITNLATGQEIAYDGLGSLNVTVPCGLFLFLDVELTDKLTSLPSTLALSKVKVTGMKNQVKISGVSGAEIRLINLQGQVINHTVSDGDEIVLPSPSGLMLVQVQDLTHKVIVQ